MSLDKDKKYLLEHVFTKVQYDDMLEKYVIRLSTYLPLTLSPQRQKLLEEMCQENNIELEQLPTKLTNKETTELFKEYDGLKKEIASSTNPNKIDELKEQAVKIRNKIIEGHLELVYRYIATIIPNIEDLNEKDDIYQSGCETLIYMIETFNPNKGIAFIQYLYLYGFDNIKRKIKHTSENEISNEDLQFLLKNIEEFIKENGIEPSKEEISSMTGFSIPRIEDLLSLEQYLSSVSLDACIDSLEEKQNNPELEYQEDLEQYLQYEHYLIDDTLENQINSIIFKILLSRILDTLTIQQSITLKMHYGLNNQPDYSQKEISEKLEIFLQSINQCKMLAIRNLKLPIYLKYLQEIIENYTDIIYPTKEQTVTEKIRKANQRKIRQLEEFLLRFLPKEELIEASQDIDSLCKEFLILLFGLDNNTHSRKEIINNSLLIESTYTRLKKEVIKKLITKLRRKYSSSEEPITEEELLDYLMYNYLNRSKTKIKQK